MSRLLRQESADGVASFGSFVIRRGQNPFRPWGSGGERGLGGDDGFSGEDQALAREDQAYARGITDGRRTAEIDFAEERQAIARLAEALPALRPEPTLPLAMLLAETVDRLVREIVGEVEIDGLRLLARAKAAAAVIGEATQPARLRVHPDDAALFADAQLDVAIEVDPELPRGSVLIETADGWIEDGPAVRLERLRAELDKVAASR
jgi:flagellar assembly protein FliH